MRTRALADFKSGSIRVLVATDIAARGLDIERLLKREIPRIAPPGFESDPSIKAEPIQNGRQQ